MPGAADEWVRLVDEYKQRGGSAQPVVRSGWMSTEEIALHIRYEGWRPENVGNRGAGIEIFVTDRATNPHYKNGDDKGFSVAREQAGKGFYDYLDRHGSEYGWFPSRGSAEAFRRTWLNKEQRNKYTAALKANPGLTVDQFLAA